MNYIPPSPENPSGIYYSGPTINTNSFSSFQESHSPFNLPLNGQPLTNGHDGPPASIFIPFSNQLSNHPDALRYHPSKKEFVQMPVRLPDEICSAHIVDPFRSKFML